MIRWNVMLAVLVVVLLSSGAVHAQGRVPFKDVTALTFRAGAKTTGRRSSPIPQLQCQGSACRRFKPQAVQCVRTGWDGHDATWRCEADLPRDMQFGQVTVSCEGYSYPDDPYILAGSCGLKYQLVYVGGKESEDEATWGITGLLIMAVIVAIVAFSCCSSRLLRYASGGGSGGGDVPPPPPYDDYYRMPSSGWFSAPAPPPSASCRPPPSSSSGPGFFSGLGVGALAGYAFGNRNRRNHAAAGAVYSEPSSRWGWGESSAPSRPSSSSSPEPARSAVGYASTERR